MTTGRINQVTQRWMGVWSGRNESVKTHYASPTRPATIEILSGIRLNIHNYLTLIASCTDKSGENLICLIDYARHVNDKHNQSDFVLFFSSLFLKTQG